MARSTVLYPGESMMNVALRQVEVYFCAFLPLTMASLCNSWDEEPHLALCDTHGLRNEVEEVQSRRKRRQ